MGGSAVDSAVDAAREAVIRLVESLDAADETAIQHRQAALDWLRSPAAIYRDGGPADPPMHLVSYFLPYDTIREAVLLVAHRKAGLDLPPGGHAEPGETPWRTVERECVEELGIAAEPVAGIGRDPLLVTVTETRGPHTHTDVSLWHVVAVRSDDPRLLPDPAEFAGTRWAGLTAVRDEPIEGLDPHMHRFATVLLKHTGR
jgi:8-oxo-dGTP diphosphatase